MFLQVPQRHFLRVIVFFNVHKSSNCKEDDYSNLNDKCNLNQVWNFFPSLMLSNAISTLTQSRELMIRWKYISISDFISNI